MVTSLTVRMGTQLQKEAFDYVINLHFSNLADFPNLVEFHWAPRYLIPREIYFSLRSHCSLRVLKIENAFDVLSEDLLGGLDLPLPRCALTMTSISRYDIMKDIFRYGSASYRTIAHLVILDAYLLQALDAEITFPSLVNLDLHLSFGTLYLPFLFKFLASNSSLERIALYASHSNLTSTHAGRPLALPHFKHFIGEMRSHSPFLSLAFGRRSLQTLSLASAHLGVKEIQNISWEGLNNIDIILGDMETQDALIKSIETLGLSGKLAWRKVTIRISNLELWTDNLDVRNSPKSTNWCAYFNDLLTPFRSYANSSQ